MTEQDAIQVGQYLEARQKSPRDAIVVAIEMKRGRRLYTIRTLIWQNTAVLTFEELCSMYDLVDMAVHAEAIASRQKISNGKHSY